MVYPIISPVVNLGDIAIILDIILDITVHRSANQIISFGKIVFDGYQCTSDVFDGYH